MQKINWILTDDTITISYNGKPYMVSRTDTVADELIQALKVDNQDQILKLVSVAKRVEEFSNGTIILNDDGIVIDGVTVSGVLAQKIKDFMDQKLPYKPLLAFAKNLQQNPSKRSVDELYLFLEKNNHPITENGCFIAYKKVRSDFKDVHSGTMDNSPGNVVEMPRAQVDSDCNRTCSQGLHAANFNYASNFYGGGVMLELEVNPSDVVSIPIDYNSAKMRVCKYKVLGIIKEEHQNLSLRVVNQDDNFPEKEIMYCESCGDEMDNSSSDTCAGCVELQESFCNSCGDEIGEFEAESDGICESCLEENEEEEENI